MALVGALPLRVMPVHFGEFVEGVHKEQKLLAHDRSFEGLED